MAGKAKRARLKIWIVLAVIIAVIVIAAVYFLTRGGVPGGLPLYPGAEVSEDMIAESVRSGFEVTAPAGASIEVYTVPASASQVLEWYRGQMSGWVKSFDDILPVSTTIAGETFSIEVGLLAFEKGNKMAAMEAFEYGGVTYLALAYSD